MTIEVVETNGLQGFTADGPLMTPLIEAGKGRALTLNLEAGQSVSPCQMSVTVLYYVIAGQGRLRVSEEQAELHTGSLTVVPAGALRSISATSRMRVLAVQIP